MPGIQIPDFVPPGLTRGAPAPSSEPNADVLAPTQPPSPAPYDGPDFISRLESAGVSKDDAIRALVRRINQDRAPKREFEVYNPNIGGLSDASGNLVVRLYDVAQGFRLALNNVLVYPSSPTTINPSAPYGAAGAFAFLAIGSAGGGTFAAQIATLYPGMIAFAPTSAAGPFLPGQWTYGNHDAPKITGGQSLFLCINGAAAIANLGFQIDLGGRLRET